MRVAIIQIPGSNCDQDAYHAYRDILGMQTEYVWHQGNLAGFDAVVIPGGFTYGDYLRTGAIASLSPVFAEVRRFAEEGRPVLGICNGFQILTETGVLPGALVRNAGRRFVCRNVRIAPVNQDTFWTRGIDNTLTVPTAHNEGRYIADDQTLAALRDQGRIAFVYAEGTNPNDSMQDIAGITNERGNVLGLMPHPERAVSEVIGGADGLEILSRIAG